MDKFLSHKRTFDDNKASTSAQTSIVSKIKSREYSQEYLNFGFTITEVNGEEKPCVLFAQKYWQQTPHTIAEELILPAAIEIVETMFGDNFARVAVHIARCKKPHTIAEELILPAAIEIVETMFGETILPKSCSPYPYQMILFPVELMISLKM
ncbi:hypothetical protein TNCV_4407911 [Trichonephila clavipes]|nr:hypothetical protein TNCV_4407911 [Trichonephila clavipes]